MWSFLHRIPRSVRLAAAVAWALVIPSLSLLPARFFQQATAIVRFPHADKVVHAVMYATMTGLLLWTLAASGRPLRVRIACFTAAGATAYGLLMEWLQHFTATRSMDLWDAVANATGAFLVAGVALMFQRFPNQERTPP